MPVKSIVCVSGERGLPVQILDPDGTARTIETAQVWEERSGARSRIVVLPEPFVDGALVFEQALRSGTTWMLSDGTKISMTPKTGQEAWARARMMNHPSASISSGATKYICMNMTFPDGTTFLKSNVFVRPDAVTIVDNAGRSKTFQGATFEKLRTWGPKDRTGEFLLTYRDEEDVEKTLQIAYRQCGSCSAACLGWDGKHE